ncbi:MAG: hypothetical protein Q4F88_01305 [Eubacteriales bacterium]|nr:hypothetical protein [Eubacteriales bacterium]
MFLNFENYDEKTLAVIGVALVGMLIFWIICALIVYIINSIAYMKIFKAYDYSHPGYAWVPFLNLHILGNLSFTDPVEFGKYSYSKKYVIWWWVVDIILCAIPRVGGFLAILLTLLCLGKCYNMVYKKLDPAYDGKALGIISALIPIVMWIKVFSSKTV